MKPGVVARPMSVEPTCPMTHTGARKSLRMHGQTERASRALTPTQRAVVELVACGLTTKGIAARLRMSPATVETHMRGARERLGARTRLQAAAVAGLGGDLRPHADDATLLLESDEQRLLQLMATGATAGEAAVSLHVSRRTCARRLAAARSKLGWLASMPRQTQSICWPGRSASSPGLCRSDRSSLVASVEIAGPRPSWRRLMMGRLRSTG